MRPITSTFFATHGNGCTATLQQAVPLVLQIPQLGWGPSSVNPELGAPVDMMNSSNVLGGTYEWIFGVEAIPSTSNDEEPEDVIFSTPGTYVVQLIGITPVGCRDTLEHVLHVIEPPAEEECGVTQITANGGNPGGNAVALMDDGSFYAWHKLETAHEMMSFSGAGDSLSADLPYSVDATSSMVLMKHDRHGVPQWWVNFWNDSYGATTSDLLADSEGNVYSAYFHDEFNDSLIIVDASGQRTGFDPVPVGAGSDAMVVTSFDAQGRLRWVHRTSAPYSNEFTCLKFLGPNGLLLVETDGMTLFNTAGDELWNVPLQYGYRDVGVGPDDHIRITERFSMVIREYDGQGTLLYTSPAYVSTPPVFGPPSITGVMSADDAAGNIYEVHNIQGQLILGTDTIYGAGTDLEDDPFCAILVRRGPAGEVIWTKRMRAFGRIVARGMELNAGRVHLLANFDGPAGTDLLIDGLDTLNVGSYNDIWLISFDLEGGSPHAEHVYTHDGSFISGYITPLNALSFSPDGQHMAYCIPYAAPLVAGTDTAYTYADFGTIQLPGVRNFGIVYGTASCLFPGLPLNDNAPQAYFVEPMGYCAGQAVPFADASLYDPVEWDWQFPGGTPATSTEAQPVITYAVPGTYTATLIATNVNGVSDPYSLDVSIDVCTGVSASDPSGFLVHPNPAQDRLFVHGPTSTTAVVCSDMEGRTVWQGVVSGSSVIDTSGWPAGSYVLQVGGCPRVRVMVMH